MGGIFVKQNRPKRPGAYFNWVAAQQEPIVVSALGTVVVGFSHPWGPENQVSVLGDLGDFLAIYGRGATAPSFTSGYAAVEQAFRGEGLPGETGAGQVLGYRIVPSGAVKASKIIQNTAGTPANAITLTARYKGTYGNGLRVGNISNARNPSTHSDLIIYDGAIELERFTYAKTDITALAADINENSDWVTAGSVTSGVALATISTPSAFTSGADGSIVAQDYTDMLANLEPWRFNVLTFDNLTDESVMASVKTWEVTQNNAGKRFRVVTGGALDEDAATGLGRSEDINDPNWINLGIGSARDTRLNGYGVMSTAQIAPRYAGILARRGDERGTTFARMADMELVVGPTTAEVTDAIEGGLVVMERDSKPGAPVRFSKAVTTYIDDTNDKPRAVYGNPKFVAAMGGIEMELTEYAEQEVIGNYGVNETTRQFLVAQARIVLQDREDRGVIQPGWTVDVDRNPPPTPYDEYIGLAIGLTFERPLEQIYYTVTIA